MKYYSPVECMNKSNQEWQMVGCARMIGDKAYEKNHTDLARPWIQRAMEGGYTTRENDL